VYIYVINTGFFNITVYIIVINPSNDKIQSSSRSYNIRIFILYFENGSGDAQNVVLSETLAKEAIFEVLTAESRLRYSGM
jgi:hypothetical protein